MERPTLYSGAVALGESDGSCHTASVGKPERLGQSPIEWISERGRVGSNHDKPRRAPSFDAKCQKSYGVTFGKSNKIQYAVG